MMTDNFLRPASIRHWVPRLRQLSRTLPPLLMLLLLLCSVGWMGIARAADASFKDEELDQMLAPIALYPDSLLSQILMAATCPSDVKEAAAWSKAHPTPRATRRSCRSRQTLGAGCAVAGRHSSGAGDDGRQPW